MRVIARLLFCLLGLASSAHAQERDAVFLHGLQSDPSKWEATTNRLATELAMRPWRPGLDWRQLYETQASNLERGFGAVLPHDIVAVGHSNGGVVARQWSRYRDVGAIVTLGTPNQGAPIVDHLFEWLQFADDYFARVSNVLRIYAQLVNHDVWWWLPAQWLPRFAAGVDIWTTANDGLLSLGLDAGLPVLPEMRVGSAYMANLNSPSNLNREAIAVPRRAAIISSPKDFDHGGPIRLFRPDTYEKWRLAIFAAGVGLDGLAGLIRILADVEDQGAFTLADHLNTVAEWFFQYEEVWCRSVSDPSPLSLGRCYEHDGIVPVWSQAYDYPRVEFIVMPEGPVHTQEIDQSDGPLLQALTMIAHVPRRDEPPSDTPPGIAPPPLTPIQPAGRYKWNGGLCVWDPADRGPDQCTPPPGRFKLDGWGVCYWEPNDNPPNQCAPPAPATGRFKLDGAGGCYWDPNDGGPNQCVP